LEHRWKAEQVFQGSAGAEGLFVKGKSILGKEKSFEGRNPRVLGAERGFQGFGQLGSRREGSQTLGTELLDIRATVGRRISQEM